jgi:CRISPR-associated protein (TIGR02710 family)
MRFGNEKYIIADLLNNAMRRIEEGKYDDAVARLYRAIEFTAQIRLKELGLIDEKRLKDNGVFAILMIKLAERLDQETIEKYKRDQKAKDLENGVIKIGLAKDYDLLYDLGDNLGKKFVGDENGLQKLLKSRNNSILAHSLKPVEKETAEELFEKVKGYTRAVLPELDELLEDANFPKL